MISNAIELLHTTEAYKAAVMRLMVDEANFVARQLNLKETVPDIAAADTEHWTVSRVPEGVGGIVTSANYAFHFQNGKFLSLNKFAWLKKISPPIQDLSELVDRPAIFDSPTGAYEWSIQLLAALSVDVPSLEAKFPPRIFQVPGRRRDEQGRHFRDAASLLAVPIFYIGWGHVLSNPRMAEIEQLRPSRPFPPKPWDPIYIEILGTTKEVIMLNINDSSLLTRPVLQVANAEELLGPLPPARHFVEKLFGGKEAYETVAAPERVEAWLLRGMYGDPDFWEKREGAGPVQLKPMEAKAFSEALLSFDTYEWGLSRCISKMYYGDMVDIGARLRFTRGSDTVEVRLSFLRKSIEVVHEGSVHEEDFSNGSTSLVKAVQAVFPNNPVAQKLSGNFQEFK